MKIFFWNIIGFLAFIPFIICEEGNQLSMRQIIDKYGINGCSVPGGTDKDTCHSYLDIYEAVLGPYREKQCNILEIGSFSGGSALIWHDYFSKSRIFLVDILDQIASNIRNVMDLNRCLMIEMDAYNLEAIVKMESLAPEGYDIIIDDGSHFIESQLFVVKFYTKLLKNGGVLIIEDIMSDDYLSLLLREAGTLDGVQVTSVDLRSLKGRSDDILLIIKKED
jgi:hypothetical protein